MRPPVALKLRLALSAATSLTPFASPEAEATGVDPSFDFGDDSFISTPSLSLCHCVRFASRTGQTDDLEALHLQAHSLLICAFAKQINLTTFLLLSPQNFSCISCGNALALHAYTKANRPSNHVAFTARARRDTFAGRIVTLPFQYASCCERTIVTFILVWRKIKPYFTFRIQSHAAHPLGHCCSPRPGICNVSCCHPVSCRHPPSRSLFEISTGPIQLCIRCCFEAFASRQFLAWRMLWSRQSR